MPVDPDDPAEHRTGRHRYVVTYVGPNCATYTVAQQVERLVREPPPQTITITESGPCNGTVLELDEEPSPGSGE